MNWTLAEAKNRLSDVVRRAANEGPQTITIRGRDTAVVVSKAAFDQIAANRTRRDFKQFLLDIPSLEGVDLDRDQTPAPDPDLAL